MDQPGKVANPARGQLNRENEHSPVPVRAWEFGLARRVQPSRPASACSSPYLSWIWCLLFRDSSRVPRRRPFIKPPYAIGSVPSLSGHAIIAYRWRSLPRVRRHRASKPQGSSERVLPWQITMDQLIFASLSHTHYWYEVGMLKVPANVFGWFWLWYVLQCFCSWSFFWCPCMAINTVSVQHNGGLLPVIILLTQQCYNIGEPVEMP